MRPRPTTDTSTTTLPVDGTDRLVFFWAAFYFTSSILSLGLTPALRGAWVGLDPWIDRLGQQSAAIAQTTAVFGCLLLIHSALVLWRVRRVNLVSILALLLGAVPAVLLFAGQRFDLPAVWLLFGTASVSAIWLALALDASLRKAKGTAWLWIWAVVVLARTASAWFKDENFLLGAQLSLTLGELGTIILLAALVTGTIRASSRPAWFAAFLFGSWLLLAQTVAAASFHAAPRTVVLLGRSLTAMAQSSGLGSGTLAMTVLITASLVAARFARGTLLGVLALSLLLPVSPLSLTALALGALALGRHSLPAR